MSMKPLVDTLVSHCEHSIINRYKRVEASLRAINIDISLTYDDESRGSRLLDRARLTTEQQRLILVGTGQAVSFDAIRAVGMTPHPHFAMACTVPHVCLSTTTSRIHDH